MHYHILNMKYFNMNKWYAGVLKGSLLEYLVSVVVVFWLMTFTFCFLRPLQSLLWIISEGSDKVSYTCSMGCVGATLPGTAVTIFWHRFSLCFTGHRRFLRAPLASSAQLMLHSFSIRECRCSSLSTRLYFLCWSCQVQQYSEILSWWPEAVKYCANFQKIRMNIYLGLWSCGWGTCHSAAWVSSCHRVHWNGTSNPLSLWDADLDPENYRQRHLKVIMFY